MNKMVYLLYDINKKIITSNKINNALLTRANEKFGDYISILRCYENDIIMLVSQNGLYFLSHVADIGTNTFQKNLFLLGDTFFPIIIGQDDLKESIITCTNKGRIVRIILSAIVERGWNYPIKLIKMFDDKVVNAYLDDGKHNYLFISRNGQILKSLSSVCTTLKRKYGIGAMAFDLKEGDEIISFFLVPVNETENDRVIILDENGYGKGIFLNSIRARRKLIRSGSKLFNAKEFSGIKLVGGCYTNDENDLIVIVLEDTCYYIYSKYFTNNRKRSLGKKIISSNSIKFIKKIFA